MQLVMASRSCGPLNGYRTTEKSNVVNFIQSEDLFDASL